MDTRSARGESKQANKHRRKSGDGGSDQVSPDVPPMKDLLLDCALELFSRKGYSETSVSEIVKAAGATQPVLYYYFENKEALFLALVDKSLARYARVLQQAVPARVSAKMQLIELVRQGYLASVQDPVLTRLLFSLGYASPVQLDVIGRVEVVIGRFIATLEDLIRDGVAQGEIPGFPAGDLALAVFSIFFKSLESGIFGTCYDPGLEGMLRIVSQTLSFPPEAKKPLARRRCR